MSITTTRIQNLTTLIEHKLQRLFSQLDQLEQRQETQQVIAQIDPILNQFECCPPMYYLPKVRVNKNNSTCHCEGLEHAYD